MTENRGIWTDLIKGVGLQMAEVFDQGQEEYIPGIGNILRSTNGDGAVINVTGKTGVGEISLFDDGDDLPGGRRYKTYTTRIAFNNYGKFVDVTANTIEDRDFDADLSEMKDLSIAANFSQDKSGLQLFNGGFSTSDTKNNYKLSLYGDLVPTFSTVHPTVVPGGSTQSNASSTSITFTHDNLETGYVNLVQQKTDDGIALSLNGKPMVILPPTLEKEGLEITKSETKPDTANRSINVYQNGMMVDMATSTHLAATNGGSDTAWFLIIPQRAKMEHVVRMSPTLDQDVNIKNLVTTFTVRARWADAVKDWRRTFGSKGDATSYSS